MSPDTVRYIPIHIDTFRYMSIHVDTFRYIFRYLSIHFDTCIEMYRNVSKDRFIDRYLSIHFDTFRYISIDFDTFRYISIHSFFVFFGFAPPFTLELLDFKLAVLLLCLLLLILLHPAPLPPDQVRFSFFRGCWFAFFVFYVSWAACVRLGVSGPGCMWGPWGSWGWPTKV